MGWHDRLVQDGGNSDQLLKDVHHNATVPNHIHNTVENEPSRGTDLTGCRANAEEEALEVGFGSVMRTTSEDRRRHCEKIRRLQQLLLLPG